MVSEPNIGRCVSEDAEPRRGWIVRFHIDLIEERVPTRTLGPGGVDCEIPHWLERGTKPSL